MSDTRLAEDQKHIDKWALICAYAWMRLKDYDEMPETLRAELLLGWSAAWLEAESAT